MNKLLKAFSLIKGKGDEQIDIELVRTKRNIEDYQQAKVDADRRIKEFEEEYKLLELKQKENKVSIDNTKIQSEIDKIYTLPIRDIKVVRTSSKTGYLPKILITTGMIKLAHAESTNINFTPFYGRELGRFLIQYDWSPRHNGTKITIINLTRQMAHYQSACISAGVPCFGNIQHIVDDLFKKKDIFNLTETILDYLENPTFGTPHVSWYAFFNMSTIQTMEKVLALVFRDYMGRQSKKEIAVIEKMIPAKELEILKRDYSKDEVYESFSFRGLESKYGCHCVVCEGIRREAAALKKYYARRIKAADDSITESITKGYYPENIITGHGNSSY